jgi:hypothetical protein
MVIDQNQYLGLKDTDGDGYPDLVDGSPENAYTDFENDPGYARYHVDTDGDGVVDALDPDRDGDGYTDNSQDVNISNNDPKLAGGQLPDQYLAEDPFDAHANEHGLAGISFDVAYPLLAMDWLNLVVYSEAGSYFGKIAQYDASGTEPELVSIPTNFGAVAPGLRANIFKFITASVEYRINSGNFIFGLWDRNYDLERVAFQNFGGTQGLKPVTRYERLYNPDGGMSQGIFGMLGANVLNLVTLQAGYQNMFMGDNPVQGIQGMVGLAPNLIPKVEDAKAYILRMNVDDPWDFVSEGTLLGYRVTVGIGGGATLTWDFRQSYIDLDGDGEINTEAGSDEVVAQTSIETGFSF